MSSSIETIGHKLQSLEERLQAENESHDRLLTEKLMETTPNRQNRKMFLPVIQAPAKETETDRKLKKIMKQTGILTINGRQYQTDIKDLEHLGDLGNGTSGNVVKMRHVPSGTIIAVKQMRRTGNSEENKRILMDLDVVLKSHDCPYIVQCLGCFVRDPDVWICMELMSMCFDKLLKLSKKPVPEDILGKVTVATVKALSYLKEKHGVIHRDVKPSNILIDERGNIKLCDFGISGRLVDSKANTRSAGCAAYMAPERIDPKKPKYDIRADVWSLGITLVELATARSPYEGCNTDFEVLTKVLDSEPPSLPHGEGFNFSQEFYAFVSKCLTKNYQYRPKYPELLEQPFIKKYEVANVDIPNWFLNIVESAGIKTHHRTIMPKTSQQDATTTAITKPCNIKNPTATTMPVGVKVTSIATNANKTQIPSYQQNNQSRYKRDDNLLQSQQQQQQQLSHQQNYQREHSNNHYHQHQPTHIPLPLGLGSSTDYFQNSNLLQSTTTDRVIGGCGAGSGSSSATSSSPLSPPNVVSSTAYYGNRDDRNGGNNRETNKYYEKSPFLQRKVNNNATYGAGVGGGILGRGFESPKGETVPTSSVLSSIGQSIIRNLTTSPFSQKKHSIPQPNQIDPLWRMPTTQDVAVAFDCYDTTTKSNKTYTNSPFLGRKRIPTVDEKIIATATGAAPSTLSEREYFQRSQQNQQATGLISNDQLERPSTQTQQRVHGSQSPIVLQRFYHQQNQLREKEAQLQQQHQNIPKQISSERQQTNPFLSNYQPQSASAATTEFGNFHYNHHNFPTHIPMPLTGNGGSTASTSSHSTSSQSSSTLSTSSQKAHTPKSSTSTLEKVLGSETAGSAFGLSSSHVGRSSFGGGQLQYQPLPHCLRSNSARNTRNSPPTSPEQLSEPIVGSSSGGPSSSVVSKLNKFYARRHMQGTGSLSSPNHGRHTLGNDFSITSAKENSLKEEHGWFNTLAGAMKRQFASYAKFQLNSSTAAQASGPAGSTASGSTAANGSTAIESAGGKTLPFYQRSTSLTANGSNNSLSPTELRPKVGGGGGGNIDSNTTTGGFLRRYAASSGAGGRINDFTQPAMANTHILAGLDRRHRSPDPPPRYNRGQSPLLLRKNLLELSGQPPGGSPLLNRRYVTASPPLPPPRRGSESVPGSPQHFRTRIHYTPEPQRRFYRTIDQ